MLPLLILILVWLALHNRLGAYAGFATASTAASPAPATSGSPDLPLIPSLPNPVGTPGTNQPPNTTFDAPLPGDSIFSQIYKFFGLPPIQYRNGQ